MPHDATFGQLNEAGDACNNLTSNTDRSVSCPGGKLGAVVHLRHQLLYLNPSPNKHHSLACRLSRRLQCCSHCTCCESVWTVLHSCLLVQELAQTAYAFQAMACLLLANIHAPNARPGITLTNLNDQNILYWLDGNTIMYYSAPDAATAWAMTNAFIQGEPSSGSEEGEHQFPAGLASVAKRQKLDLGKVAVGDATAGLSDLAAFLDHDEMKASQAASLLRELHGMPVFSGLARPLPDMMYA